MEEADAFPASDTAPIAWAVGVTVPWSVAWSEETGFDLRPSVDFPGLVDLIQPENPGAGKPMFAVNHVTRNRLGLVRHLCHVCGRPTEPGDRWLFPVQTGGFLTMHDGETRYGGNVPPVHEACAERARRLCPHLSRQFARPTPFPADEGRMVPRTDVVPGMEALAARLPAGLKVVLSCYRLHGPEFTETVRRLRDAAGGLGGAPAS